VKEIEFTSAAVRQWRKNRNHAGADRPQIEGVRGVGDVRALKGVAGMRLRSGDWRVVFTVSANTITIHAVGHRRDIYD
jgi:mRNA interferase RelE/StbE